MGPYTQHFSLDFSLCYLIPLLPVTQFSLQAYINPKSKKAVGTVIQGPSGASSGHGTLEFHMGRGRW